MAILFISLLILSLTSRPGDSSVETFRYLSHPYGGSISIPCFYEHRQKDHAKYWCTAKNVRSCTILGRNETERRIGNISITNDSDKLAFFLTLWTPQRSNSGHYWCAVEINGRTEFSESLHLAVTDAQHVRTVSWVSAERGGSVTIPCYYDQKYKHHVKYWCRGSAWHSCSSLARSDSNQAAGKVSISDDPAHLVFNVTMRDLQDKDTDTYWCAVEIHWAADDRVFLPLIIRNGNVMPPSSTTQNENASSATIAKEASSTASSSFQLILALTLGLLLLALLLAIVVGAKNMQGKRRANNDDTQNRPTIIPSVVPDDAMTYSTISLQEPVSEEPAGLVVYSTLVLKQTKAHE